MCAFELYDPAEEKPRSSRRQGIGLTIGAATVGLNLDTYAALGEPTHVQLLYDPAARLIGLRGCRPDAQAAIRVWGRRKAGKVREQQVSARGFYRRYDVDIKPARWCPGRLEGGMVQVSAPRPDEQAERESGGHLPKHVRATILARIKVGERPADLAREFRTTTQTIARIGATTAAERRGRSLPDEVVEQIVGFGHAGYSITRIAKLVGATTNTVDKYLARDRLERVNGAQEATSP
jgi:hypothetical protein